MRNKPFTPGPWAVVAEDVTEEGEYFEPRVVTDEEDPRIIAIVRIGLEGTDANARLISAAPDLLAACKSTLGFLYSVRARAGDPLRSIQDRAHGPYRDRLEAAIAKAEGVE